MGRPAIPAGEPAQGRSFGDVGARWSDAALDVVLVVLATWTVVYHVCFVARLGTTVAVVLEVVLLALAGVLRWRWRPAAHDVPAPTQPESTTSSSPSPGVARRVLAVCGAATVVAAVAMASSAPFVLVWVPWLVATGAGLWWAVRHAAGPETDPATQLETDTGDEGLGRTLDRLAAPAALAWAVAMAVFAAFSLRPNPDDLFYVNLSQWVAAHGDFPHRDTLFGNLTFPMTNWPPVASYDGGVGVVARLTSSAAATVEYEVVPPVVALLSVLALWRLLRAWRVPHLAVVLSVAMVFLLFDGTSSYGPPGNLWVTRLWQGKVILLCLLVPLLLALALKYVERPSRPGLAMLGVGGVASVGLSTTAIFLVPLLALAGVAPLLRRDRRAAVLGFVAMAVYPLGAGVVTTAIGGHSADDFGSREQYRFDASFIGHEVFLTGAVAAVGVAAVLLGVLLVPHRDARVTTGLAVLFTGLVMVPGLTHLSYDVTGLGPTLWRISWGCTIAALVGVAVVRLGSWLLGARGALGAAVVVGLVLGLLGPPIWGSATGTSFAAPFHWQRGGDSRVVADAMIHAAGPGGVVLAPNDLSITVAVTTTAVKTVAPRAYYMDYLRDAPGFQFADRTTLVDFANDEGLPDVTVLTAALKALDVDVACTHTWNVFPTLRLETLPGYRPLLHTTATVCVQRT